MSESISFLIYTYIKIDQMTQINFAQLIPMNNCAKLYKYQFILILYVSFFVSLNYIFMVNVDKHSIMLGNLTFFLFSKFHKMSITNWNGFNTFYIILLRISSINLHEK